MGRDIGSKRKKRLMCHANLDTEQKKDAIYAALNTAAGLCLCREGGRGGDRLAVGATSPRSLETAEKNLQPRSLTLGRGGRWRQVETGVTFLTCILHACIRSDMNPEQAKGLSQNKPAGPSLRRHIPPRRLYTKESLRTDLFPLDS